MPANSSRSIARAREGEVAQGMSTKIEADTLGVIERVRRGFSGNERNQRGGGGKPRVEGNLDRVLPLSS